MTTFADTGQGTYFGQTPEFWMNAQTAYELSKELTENGEDIRSRIRRHPEDHATIWTHVRPENRSHEADLRTSRGKPEAAMCI